MSDGRHTHEITISEESNRLLVNAKRLGIKNVFCSTLIIWIACTITGTILFFNMVIPVASGFELWFAWGWIILAWWGVAYLVLKIGRLCFITTQIIVTPDVLALQRSFFWISKSTHWPRQIIKDICVEPTALSVQMIQLIGLYLHLENNRRVALLISPDAELLQEIATSLRDWAKRCPPGQSRS